MDDKNNLIINIVHITRVFNWIFSIQKNYIHYIYNSRSKSWRLWFFLFFFLVLCCGYFHQFWYFSMWFTIGLALKLTENILFSRWFKKSAESFTKVPLFGAVSNLTLAVSPFCVIFAIVWAVYRDASYAWIGQDILVRIYLLFFF